MAQSFKQGTSAPTTKVMYGGIAGAISIVIVWALNEFKILPNGTQIPGEIASAITTILTFVVSYVVPPGAKDQVVKEELSQVG
jgi:hypothetical protein